MSFRVKYLGFEEGVFDTVGKYQLLDFTATEYEQARHSRNGKGDPYWHVTNVEVQKADEQRLGVESLGPQATPDPEWDVYTPSHFVDKNGNWFRHY